jgi:hypothetical protein
VSLRTRALTLLAAAALAGGIAAGAGAGLEPPKPRPVTRADLRAALLASPKVKPAVKRFIREGSGDITPAVVARAIRTGARLGDLTGDGLRDAAAPLGFGGSGGDDQGYVVSAHSGPVKVIYARTGILGVRVRILRKAKLLEVTLPEYAPGDANCCPSHQRITTYRISPTGHATKVRERRVETP